MSTRRLATYATAWAILGITGITLGQAELRPGEPPLGGPRVKDREVPGVREAFAEGSGGRFMQRERLPLPVFVEAVRSLQSPDAPAEVRLSQEQESTIRGLVTEFERQAREYRAAHRDDLRRLRQQAGPRDGGARAGAPAPGGAEGMAEGEAAGADQGRREAAAERLREIERNAPRVEDLYTRVWEHLSEPQRRWADAKLDAWRQERAKQREDEYVRQRMAKKGPVAEQGAGNAAGVDKAPPDPRAAKRPPAGADEDRRRAERRQRVLRYFEQLPPEEQDRILERLEERIRERGLQGRPGGQARPGPAGDLAKPPPGVDRVRVPDPGSMGRNE
jgi:hypothetical protein